MKLGGQSRLRSDYGDCASSRRICLADSLVSRKMGDKVSRGASAKCTVYIKERQAVVTAGILKIKKKKKKKKRILSLALSVKCSGKKRLLATLVCSTWWNIYSPGSGLCPSEM